MTEFNLSNLHNNFISTNAGKYPSKLVCGIKSYWDVRRLVEELMHPAWRYVAGVNAIKTAHNQVKILDCRVLFNPTYKPDQLEFRSEVA